MSIFEPVLGGRITKALAVLVVIACGQVAFGQSPRDVRAFFSQAMDAEARDEVRLATQLRVSPADHEEETDAFFDAFEPTAKRQEVSALASIDLGAAFDPLLSSSPAARSPQAGLLGRYGGAAATLDYPWAQRNLVRRPLYFQDVLLERHGFTYGPVLQPIKSGLRFFGDYLVFPFRVVKQPCHQRQSVLGLDRPGS